MEKLKDEDQMHSSDRQAVEEFIGKREAGRRLSLRPRTIDDWMKRGLLPYYKVGRSVRFKWSEVEQHLGRNCRVNPKPSIPQ